MFCYCWGPGETKSCKLRLSTTGILPHSCYVASGAFPWALLCWPNVLGPHLELEQTSTKTIPLHQGASKGWLHLASERGLTQGTALEWCLGSKQRKHRMWIDYPRETPESWVLSASPVTPDNLPWSGLFIFQHLYSPAYFIPVSGQV